MPEVKVEEARRFMMESLVAGGAPQRDAEAHADLLLHADVAGHFSHGMNRLELYINDMKLGACDPRAELVVLKETAATAWVDGGNALGATIGNFCIDLAIKKAKECGVGWVAAKRCNHYGMAGYWALKAEKEGLIGMSFTNTAPILVPTRAKQSALGTNPISLAAPASGGDSLVVDLATTTAAMGKIEMEIRKGKPIPEGWALGPDGETTKDAQVAFETGRLLPLGGFENTSGYKGYALSAMVEVFCSGLSGSNATHEVPSWSHSQTAPPDLGQCFVAIDPACFAPGFQDRVGDCLRHWRNMEPVRLTMPEVKVEEARRFMMESLVAGGAPQRDAEAHADLLLHADVAGHFSHGMNRLELYINDMKLGACDPRAELVVLKETAATAWVDGGNALGATIGNFCIDLAIKKAKECGVGWVAAKRCNHYGMAGYWALKAEKEGLIGMSFTNTAPILVPTRAKQSALGTNPISLAAPASGGDSLVVDLATTTAAMGKIEMEIRKGKPIPEGWALGPDGETTKDAQVAFETGRLLPLGGFENTSGYKGYALSAMVEVFCSGLSGSNATHEVPSWSHSQTAPPDLGQCFVAIDPACFAPGFQDRVGDCLRHWRNMEPVDPALPVLAPGDKEKMNAKTTVERGTIVYPQQQIDTSKLLAERIGIRPLEVIT